MLRRRRERGVAVRAARLHAPRQRRRRKVALRTRNRTQTSRSRPAENVATARRGHAVVESRQRESRLIYGFHAVLGKLRRDAGGIFELYLADSRSDMRAREVHKIAEAEGVRIIAADNERLERMVGTRRHQGVVARVDARTREIKLA